MIQKILVPQDKGQRYYGTHYRFFIEAMREAGVKVETGAVLKDYEVSFEARIDGRPVVIDFSDHHRIEALGLDLPIFKYHFSRAQHGDMKNVFPFSPISFYDWRSIPEISYQPEKSNRILNAQRPGGAATKRRREVKTMLREAYWSDLDAEITDQAEFWKRAGECFVAVCVPGARLDILDRGQLQLMALGVCTISPVLEIDLPWERALRPGVDYLTCRPDYSNLLEAIEDIRRRPETARAVGRSAQELFESCLTPGALARWIDHCLESQR